MAETSEQALLDEHQSDTCEVEMGACTAGCRPACPRAYCTSERHKGDVAPEWPCRVVRPILGVKTVEEYWEREDAAWLAWYESQEQATYASVTETEQSAPEVSS